MGGTFDPPHLGHLALARAARDELGLDAVLYVPAGNPSFKRDRSVTPAERRLEMLRLMLADEPGSYVSRMEVDRKGVTYSVDTLEELRLLWPEPAGLVFIMGADSLRTLPHWRRAQRVLQLAQVAVAGRDGESLQADVEALLRFAPAARVHVLRTQVPRVSSTQLRAALLDGRGASCMLAPAVEDYIRTHGLYAH